MDAITLEQIVLRSLCQGNPSLAQPLYERIHRYSFRDSIHQLIFDELRSGLAAGRGLAKAELQSRLTRRGFPDVDLAPYYATPGCSQAEILRALKKLLDLD